MKRKKWICWKHGAELTKKRITSTLSDFNVGLNCYMSETIHSSPEK